MKNLLLAPIFCFSFICNAQNWIQPNSVWHFDYSNISDGGFIRLNYNSDTLIQGKNCQKITSKQFRFGSNQNGNTIFIDSSSLPSIFTFNSGDTVFYLDNTSFRVLFNLNEQLGNTYLMNVDQSNTNFLCNDSSFQKVVGFGSILVAGQSKQSISVDSTANSGKFHQGMFIQGIGMAETQFGNHHFFIPTATNCDTTLVVEFSSYKFKCFQNDTLMYNPSGEDCEYLLTYLGVDESNESDGLLLFPNPSNGITQLISEKSGTYTVSDNLGRLINSGTIEAKTPINIQHESWPKGIYMISFLTDNTVRTSLKWILE